MELKKVKNKIEWLELYVDAYKKALGIKEQNEKELKMNYDAHPQVRFVFVPEKFYIENIAHYKELIKFIELRINKILK